MVLMPENATLPDAVTRVIELPAAAAEAARENAARGLDEANAAREPETGLENAAAASEQGRETAQQNREDRGRGASEGGGGGPPDSGGRTPEAPLAVQVRVPAALPPFGSPKEHPLSDDLALFHIG